MRISGECGVSFTTSTKREIVRDITEKFTRATEDSAVEIAKAETYIILKKIMD